MHIGMEIYPRTAAERAMKLQEVLLRATSGKIKWWQAAELMGISDGRCVDGGNAWRRKAARACWTGDGGSQAAGECRRRRLKRL
jgi:hypothetical protein